MFQSAVWTLKWNDAICHFLKEGCKHVSTNLSVLCPINSTFKNEINLSPVKAHTTISKPVEFACLLPPMECGKETFFSHGTISSTLHQVKFNCFHFLESLGISPAGGGARRRRWKISLCLIHFTLDLYPSFSYHLFPGFSLGSYFRAFKEMGNYGGRRNNKYLIGGENTSEVNWPRKQWLVTPPSLLSND